MKKKIKLTHFTKVNDEISKISFDNSAVGLPPFGW